mmetsp:Transcript_13821/g.55289  ORF Transcript_13821/g.55289 Transcript_13821/m.55289 type:complete len:217 (-) Transcript_13821:618-1268(-)
MDVVGVGVVDAPRAEVDAAHGVGTRQREAAREVEEGDVALGAVQREVLVDDLEPEHLGLALVLVADRRFDAREFGFEARFLRHERRRHLLGDLGGRLEALEPFEDLAARVFLVGAGEPRLIRDVEERVDLLAPLARAAQAAVPDRPRERVGSARVGDVSRETRPADVVPLVRRGRPAAADVLREQVVLAANRAGAVEAEAQHADGNDGVGDPVDPA